MCVGVELGNGACHGDWAVKGNTPEVLVHGVGWAVLFLEAGSDLDSGAIVDLNVCKG